MADKSSIQKDFIAFVSNPRDVHTVEEVFQKIVGAVGQVFSGDLRDAIKYFSRERSPKILIVDLADINMSLSLIGDLSNVCEPGVKVIVLGQKNDVGLYRELMSLGVSEYIVAPILPEILFRSLENMLGTASISKEKTAKKGKLLVVAGGGGGVGVSSIVTGMGCILSQKKSRRVAIIDMNLHMGTVCLTYDLNPNHGLREALENPDRIDDLFLERLMLSVNERLQILASEEPFDEHPHVTLDGLDTLIEYLAERYHYIIVDLPRQFSRVLNSLVENANVLILVSDSALSSVRDTARYKQLFGQEGGGRRIVYVVNKRDEFRQGELTPEYFERFLERPVDHFIPFDGVFPLSALNKGDLQLDSKSPLWQGIEVLVGDLVGEKNHLPDEGVFEKIRNMIKGK